MLVLDTASLNTLWAKKLIEELLAQGVSYFCLSPGSRATPLVIAIAENKKAKTFVHFDERGTAFHALGYAKATQIPAVLVVTSGTALGNLLPAVMEASLSMTPLILLTADRPPELRDCGSNQTLDQIKIFQDYVRWQFDLPCPDAALPENFLKTTISQAVFRARLSPQGPVHLNCMLREPFFNTQTISSSKDSISTIYDFPCLSPTSTTLERWKEGVSNIEKGVIIAGYSTSLKNGVEIDKLSETLKWPIITDINSSLRSEGPKPQRICHHDYILKIKTDWQPEAIIHFGDRLVSKILLEWIGKAPSLRFYGQIADHPLRHDPKHSLTHRVFADPNIFAREFAAQLSQAPYSSWMESWTGFSLQMQQSTEKFFNEQNGLCEPELFHTLAKILSPDWALFISNSMPIRDADHFLFPTKKIGPVFSNRGVSGIDGNIATAVGIAQGAQMPTLAILGDLACLHDLNSLAQLKKSRYPVVCLVINNSGGGLFSFLPIAEKKNIFEEYFATPHDLQFKELAPFFDIPYYQPKTKADWQSQLFELLQNPHSCILEIQTERGANYVLHQEIFKFVNTAAEEKKTCSLSPATAI